MVLNSGLVMSRWYWAFVGYTVMLLGMKNQINVILEHCIPKKKDHDVLIQWTGYMSGSRSC